MTEQRNTTTFRASISAQANACCEYCRSQERFSPDPFVVEHIVPLSRGGETIPANLAYACQGCNGHKYTFIAAFDPATGEMSALFHPRQQLWLEHFVWNADFTIVIGISPAGRATVERLQLNRPGLVNLRHLLAPLHLHPPDS